MTKHQPKNKVHKTAFNLKDDFSIFCHFSCVLFMGSVESAEFIRCLKQVCCMSLVKDFSRYCLFRNIAQWKLKAVIC